MIIALAGNQNCGKTTLFNRLTGSRQHVGNWPGVTVEKKSGRLLPRWLPDGLPDVQATDLPGVYSLEPFSQEEEITRHFLTDDAFDVIINVLDATHLERNLYLTLQLLQLQKPMVIALNMMDEVQSQGDALDIPLLSKTLGVPAVPVCARDGWGLETLVSQAARAAQMHTLPPDDIRCSGEARQTIQEMARLLSAALRPGGKGCTAANAAATAFLEGDLPQTYCSNDGLLQQALQQCRQRLEARTGQDAALALAAGRYRYLEELVQRCYAKGNSPKQAPWLDELLVRSGWSVPIWLCILLLMFVCAFGLPGRFLTDALDHVLQAGSCLLGRVLATSRVAPGLRSLLLNGILPGVCSVLSFVPPLLLLMLFLHLLEESGLLARAAFLMDRPLRALGLSGRSLITLLLGFGCTVPAVLSARGMKNRRQRCLTVLLTPLMSCGAKLPVYVLVCSTFFPQQQALVMAGLYLTGILTAVAAGLAAQNSARPGQEEPFLLELPAYRRPSLGNALRELWQRGSELIGRIFSVILLAALAVWVLSNHTFSFAWVGALEESMLGAVASRLAPVFSPCGFGNGAAVAALLMGLLAKENIVSTLTVLAGSGLSTVFANEGAALAFLVFVLFYPPCAAAAAAIRRELGHSRWAVLMYAGHLLLAWFAAMLVYQLSRLFV